MNASPEDIAIPAAQVKFAMAGLREHIRTIHEAAMWLYCEGHHAAASYFAILCMEEISKHHLFSSRRGKGVTMGDMEGMKSHKRKIFLFLLRMGALSHPGAAGTHHKPRFMANYSLVAARLNTIKQLAVYHEYMGGRAVTLEGLLGRDRLFRVSTRLQRIACQGLASMGSTTCRGQDSPIDRGDEYDRGGIDACLTALMRIAHDVPASIPHKDGIVLARGNLSHALSGLEWHIGALDDLAARLHNSGHHGAAIFMYIMSFEEANKHYVVAKCRRHDCDVKKADMKILRKHYSKLSVFFRDVEAYQKIHSIDKDTNPTEKYHTVDPDALMRLDGLKKLSLYFNYMCCGTITLRCVANFVPGGVSTYLDKILRGMVSWIILSDGNSEDPYDVHDTNRMHVIRLKKYVDFKMDVANREYDEFMYHEVGLFDELNGAMEKRDVDRFAKVLTEIRKAVMASRRAGPS